MARVLKDEPARRLRQGTSANSLAPGGDVEAKPPYRFRQAWPLSPSNKTQMARSRPAVPGPPDGFTMTSESNLRITEVENMETNSGTDRKQNRSRVKTDQSGGGLEKSRRCEARGFPEVSLWNFFFSLTRLKRI